MAVNLSTIIAKIKQNVIDLPSDTDARLESWVNEAQLDVEDGDYQFLFMRTSLFTNTTLGVNLLRALPVLWIRADGDPWYRTGGGVYKRMEWAPSEQDVAKDFTAGVLATDRGRPRRILETDTQLLVYPPPDASNTLGAFSAAGEYSVATPHYAKEPTLEASGSTTNKFTADPNLALYLEDFASGQAMLFNRDLDNGQVSLLKAQRHLQRAVRLDKRRRAQFLRLTPRRDSHASRKQRRAI